MLRLKENPIEWFKFTAVMAVVVNLILWMLHWRGVIPFAIPAAVAGMAFLIVTIAAIRPRWFRGFYRIGMTVSHQVGQFIGKVLLILLFFLIVTPLGLFLRLLGKDLLLLRKTTGKGTYWHPARNTREFDRMF